MRTAAALAAFNRWAAHGLSRGAAFAGKLVSARMSGITQAVKRRLRIVDGPFRIAGRYMPKGLYARALVIVIAPVVILQSVIALCVHGAPLADRDATALGRRLFGYRRAGGDLRILSAGQQYLTFQRIAETQLGFDVDVFPNASSAAPPGPFLHPR